MYDSGDDDFYGFEKTLNESNGKFEFGYGCEKLEKIKPIETEICVNHLESDIDNASEDLDEIHDPFADDVTLPLIKRRKKNPSGWAKNKNQAARMRGDKYFGKKKINSKEWDYKISKKGKVMKPPCQCSGKGSLKCGAFTNDERKHIFRHFWENLNTWQEKRLSISMLVLRKKPVNLRNRLVDSESRRSISLRYHLKTDAKILPVCKVMFLNTYGITQKVVYKALAAFDSKKKPNESKRPINKFKNIREKKRASAELFLSKLNKMESHFCRASSKKLYLEPNWTSLLHLYREYKNYCAEIGVPVLCKSSFYETFHDMNLGLFSPKKDQCDTCCGFKTGSIDCTTHQQHIINKNCAEKEKERDTKTKKNVCTMDVQRVLLSPQLKASIAYYKMKLCVRNFTIFDNILKDGYCYVWHEGEGGVTANEFASLVCKYIDERETSPGEELIFYSDGCTYQNRNVTISNALMNMAIQKRITIIQKYLEKGHTQMECDSMHSTVERRIKKKEIYEPKGYVLACLKARINPKPYHVEYMTFNYFKDFNAVKFLSSIRPGKGKGDPTVTNLRGLMYLPNGEIKYKLHYVDDWKDLPQKRDLRVKSIPYAKLPDLYTERCKIKEKKFDHLQDMKMVIPKEYHYFYDNLLH